MKHNNTLTKTKKALFSLMEKKGFDEITVTDIVRESGLSRQNFYKNFENKQELINEIFVSDVCSAISGSVLFDTEKALKKIFLRFEEHKVFYLGLLRSSMNEHLYRMLCDYALHICKIFARYTIFSVLDETLEELFKFYLSGAIVLLFRFLSGDEDISVIEAVKQLMKFMPAELKKIILIDDLTSEFVIYNIRKFKESWI